MTGNYKHGTRNGLRRHRAEGSEPCIACLKAEADYKAKYAERLKNRPSRAEIARRMRAKKEAQS